MAVLGDLGDSTALLHRAQDRGLSPKKRLVALGALGAALDALYTMPLASSLSPAEPAFSPLSEGRANTITQLLDDAAQILHESILPDLAAHQQAIIHVEALTTSQRAGLGRRFEREIFPLLLPLAVDPGHPFPRLSSGDLHLLVQLRSFTGDSIIGGRLFAVVRVPPTLPRLFPLAASRSLVGPRYYVWKEEVVRWLVNRLFPGIDVTATHLFRVLRREGGAEVAGKPTGTITRLDLEGAMPRDVRRWLSDHLQVTPEIIVRSRPPMALADLALPAAGLAEQLWVRRSLTRLVETVFGHL